MDSGSSSYDNRCRLCIAESRLSLQLFETEAIRIDIVDKIRSYLSINIAMSDGLPQQICYECLSRIELFHSYKQSCLESQHTLKHWNFLFCDGGSVPDEIFSGTTSSALQERNRNLLRTSSQPSCSSKNISNLSSILTSSENRKSFPSVPFVKHLQARSNSASSRNVGLLTDEIELLSPEKQMRKMLENVNLIHTSKDVDSESRSDTTSAIECNRGSRAFSEPPPSPVRNVDHETSIKPSPQSSEAIDKITGSDSSPDGKVKSPRRSRSLTRSPPPHFWLRTRNSGRSNKSKDIVKKSSSKKVNGSQPSILDTEIRTRSKMSTASVSQNSEDLTPSSKSSASGTTGKLSGVTNDGSLSPSSGSAVSKNKHIKKSLLEIFAKGFSPSISEIVKQRRRIIPLNESTTGGGQGPILGTIVEGEENSTEKMKKNVDSSYALIDKVSDDDIIASLSEADTVSIASEGSKYGNESENVEDSTKALLRILESDNESYDDQENGYSSDFYQSDIQNDDSNICTSPSGSQNPKSAYVRVEKLSPEIDSKSSVQRIKDYETLTPKRRPRKDKGQSNQYRLVKIVKDETGKERFKCLKCGSLLSHRTYIKEHMKIHTGDKSFICIICNKAFRNNYLLKSHMGVHTKERNFKCDICGHTFVQRDRLRSHLRIHKLEPCKCKICGRVLTQKQSLLRHMRLHTGERPFKCDYCENTFADRTTWINHTRTHTGERPFKCPVRSCSRTFNLQVHVFSHVRSHIEDRPFQCQICTSAQFKTQQHLQRHMDFAHKELITEVSSSNKPPS